MIPSISDIFMVVSDLEYLKIINIFHFLPNNKCHRNV